ncbi:MAG TPA: hypothetical protein DD738_01860 [Ruminiclostridium sp.]|nr:hypothetical protein [Ruminiclostridium sp.]
MKIGIIGVGTMGRVHAKCAVNSGMAEVTSVFDLVRENADKIASQYSAKAFTDIDEFLSSDIDMVFVCVPNTGHAEIAIKALNAGKHVFCEKPLAISVEQVYSIKEAANKSGKRVFTGLNRRFAPVYKHSKDVVRQADYKPMNFHMLQNDGDMGGAVWVAHLDALGGFLYDSTIHSLDMAEYMMGEVDKLWTLGISACYSLDDDFVIMLKFKSGGIGTITSCGHASWIYPFERMQVVGDHRSIITEELETFRYCPSLTGVIEAAEYTKLPFEVKWGYQDMHKHMYDALLNGKKAENDLDVGIRSVRLVDACYKSAAAGGKEIEV